MASIPYSLQNFRVLAERESKRGKDLSRVVPQVKAAVTALRDRRERYRMEVSKLVRGTPAHLDARDKYLEERRELRKRRDDALEETLQHALQQFETALSEGSFTFGLKPAIKVGDRQTYRTANDLPIVFPAKQATSVIRNLRFGESYSRNSTTRALKEALGKKYSHAIYRLDIKRFFSSIPHQKLLSKLRNDPRLDRVTETLVGVLLSEFSEISGSPTGVPQGVGLSSHLAEFYMHDFDREVKTAPGVLFYARYVDDIVLVMDTEATLVAVKNLIVQALEDLQLSINEDKTTQIIAGPKGDYPRGLSLSYLGYCFTRADGSLTTNLTGSRQRRRVMRLQKSMQHWLDGSPDKDKPNTGRDGIFLDRVRYLAGNTKLLNSKANVAVGLYFSNSVLDADAKELKELDVLLNEFVDENSDKMCPQLIELLSDISFTAAFRNRPFYRFSQRRLKQIVQLWREVEV